MRGPAGDWVRKEGLWEQVPWQIRDRKKTLRNRSLVAFEHACQVLISLSLIRRRKKKRSALALFPNNALFGTKGQAGPGASFAVTSASERTADCTPPRSQAPLARRLGNKPSTSEDRVATHDFPPRGPTHPPRRSSSRRRLQPSV